MVHYEWMNAYSMVTNYHGTYQDVEIYYFSITILNANILQNKKVCFDIAGTVYKTGAILVSAI